MLDGARKLASAANWSVARGGAAGFKAMLRDIQRLPEPYRLMPLRALAPLASWVPSKHWAKPVWAFLDVARALAPADQCKLVGVARDIVTTISCVQSRNPASLDVESVAYAR